MFPNPTPEDRDSREQYPGCTAHSEPLVTVLLRNDLRGRARTGRARSDQGSIPTPSRLIPLRVAIGNCLPITQGFDRVLRPPTGITGAPPAVKAEHPGASACPWPADGTITRIASHPSSFPGDVAYTPPTTPFSRVRLISSKHTAHSSIPLRTVWLCVRSPPGGTMTVHASSAAIIEYTGLRPSLRPPGESDLPGRGALSMALQGGVG
jgi:hypothetical protein